ncbi:MAG: glutathione peroxidase [Tenericutes bacterium]|jgi:glutathione peroxidase|nr:glutathione peroxidase [Mycoplasmatota bacterium]
MSVYKYKIKNTKNEDVSLEKYKGKVLLIVNTATKCGYTPQYEGLEDLYKKYKDKGLEIIDLPCNQFMSQAPGSNEDVAEFCKVNFGTRFETFAKVKVNGKDTIRLYKYLKSLKPYDETPGEEGDKPTIINKLTGSKIKWNFTKFLIDRDGEVYGRYGSRVEPKILETVIEKIIIKQKV